MKEVQLHASRSSRILIGGGLRHEVGIQIAQMNCHPETAAVITDSNVDRYYSEEVVEKLKENGLQVFKYVFPAGEASKNLSEYCRILEFLASAELTRNDVVIALGGGVTGDLAGFAASTYLRGVHLVQIPTTLLAAVDSSVGGKTAVDLKAGKNQVGTFYQPELVLCDPEVLKTLPKKVLLDGVAESVKYGVLNDPELYRIFDETPLERISWEEVILRCVQSKVSFVEQDEKDTGARQMLNYGHTIGHAIEICSNFDITHGHAVAIGMVLISRGAYKAGIVSKDLSGTLNDTLSRLGLPVSCEFDAESMYEVVLHDKKRKGSTITIVAADEIGNAQLYKIPMSQMEQVIAEAVSD